MFIQYIGNNLIKLFNKEYSGIKLKQNDIFMSNDTQILTYSFFILIDKNEKEQTKKEKKSQKYKIKDINNKLKEKEDK